MKTKPWCLFICRLQFWTLLFRFCQQPYEGQRVPFKNTITNLPVLFNHMTLESGSFRKNNKENKNCNQISRLPIMCLTEGPSSRFENLCTVIIIRLVIKIIAFCVCFPLTDFMSDSLWCLLSPGVFRQCTTGVKHPWIIPSTCSLLQPLTLYNVV